MPGFFRNVVGGVAGYEAFIQTMPPLCREESVIWDRRWTYQRRSPDTVPQWDQTFIATGCWWPMNRSGAIGDPASWGGFFTEGCMGAGNGEFAAWEYGLGGSQSRKFIMGQCKNAAGDPLGGTVVQGFKTADDTFIGQTEADDKGRYELGCPQTPSDQHYLVAYYASGNLAGTTVNTLTPTWRDGS